MSDLIGLWPAQILKQSAKYDWARTPVKQRQQDARALVDKARNKRKKLRQLARKRR